MKPGISLNPNAASYVPLFQKKMNVENEVSKMTGKDPKSDKALPESASRGTEELPVSVECTLNGYTFDGCFGSSSQNQNVGRENQVVNEEIEMDLAYLKMTFPGFSDESLEEVYMAHQGDLDAAVDILSQLEFYSSESSKTLLATMDIGDLSEPGATSECASSKQKR